MTCTLHAVRRSVRRGAQVVAGSLNARAPLLFGAALSYLVIRGSSLELWGSFAALLVLVQPVAQVVAWGNRDFLLLAASRRPADLARDWWGSLVTRALLLVPLAPLALLVRPGLLLALWTVLVVLAQSFEVLVVFRRVFARAVAIEGVGFALAAVGVVAAGGRLTLELLLAIAVVTTLVRVLLLAATFRHDLVPVTPLRPDLAAHLGRALPFLLLGLTGLLTSRTDLYCVALLLDRPTLGAYQVLTSFLVLLQSIPAFLLLPFLKGLYRLPAVKLASLALRLPAVGLAILVPALPALHLVLSRLYGIVADPLVLAVGGLTVLLLFANAPLVYLAFRDSRQSFVVRVNLVGFGVSLAASLALVPALGLLGAVSAGAASQLVMLTAYALDPVRRRRG